MNTQLGHRFSHWTNIIQYRFPVRNIFATDSFATTPTRIPQNMAKFFLKITVKYVRSLTRPNTGENIVKVERRRSAPQPYNYQKIHEISCRVWVQRACFQIRADICPPPSPHSHVTLVAPYAALFLHTSETETRSLQSLS